jgi:CheY-like chemotaxis protein
MSVLTDEEKTLLSKIIEKGIRIIKVKVGAEGVMYDGFDDILVEEEYDWDYVRELFQSLAKKKFLLPKEPLKVILCPDCGSPHVYVKYACPKCQSSNVESTNLIEHPYCGYTGVLKNFTSGSKLICPNCSTELRSLRGTPREDDSKKDYLIIGSMFECEDCGNRFERPNFLHVCQKCDAEFNYRSSICETLYNYEIPENIIENLRKTQDILVLLIEDSLEDAEIINKTITKTEKNIKIETVNSGKDGLNKINTKYYDVILLDYKLPDMSGIDVLEKIKEKNIRVSVIMLTGADEREIAVEAMKLGASDFLVKSLDTYKKLPAIIKKLIKK